MSPDTVANVDGWVVAPINRGLYFNLGTIKMSMLQSITKMQKQLRLEYMKTKDADTQTKATVLTTLIGELDTKAKNDGQLTDESIQATIRKFLKSNGEMLSLTTDGPTAEKLLVEQTILNSFLPQQLTNNELTQIIEGMWQENETITMGMIMANLKQHYAGLYDGKAASTIAKQVMGA